MPPVPPVFLSDCHIQTQQHSCFSPVLRYARLGNGRCHCWHGLDPCSNGRRPTPAAVRPTVPTTPARCQQLAAPQVCLRPSWVVSVDWSGVGSLMAPCAVLMTYVCAADAYCYSGQPSWSAYRCFPSAPFDVPSPVQFNAKRARVAAHILPWELSISFKASMRACFEEPTDLREASSCAGRAPSDTAS